MAMLLMGGCSKDKVTSTTDKKISIQTTIEEPANMGSPSLNEDGSGNFAPGDTFSLLVFAPDASAVNVTTKSDKPHCSGMTSS